jgi:hypothetical protein
LVPSEQKPTAERSGQYDGWLETHSDFAALVIVGIGFMARLKAAAGTFLNPDEALHFRIANHTSWPLAYQAP